MQAIALQINSSIQDVHIFIDSHDHISFISVRSSVFSNTFIIQAITISTRIQINSFIQDIHICIDSYDHIGFFLIRISKYRHTFIIQAITISTTTQKKKKTFIQDTYISILG